MTPTITVAGVIFALGSRTVYQVRVYNPGRVDETFIGRYVHFNVAKNLMIFEITDYSSVLPGTLEYCVNPDDIIRAQAYEEGTGILPWGAESVQPAVAPAVPSEIDPNGIDAHAPGAKLDAGKPLANDILSQFPRALTAIVKVGTYGANKYTLGGWIDVYDGVRRYKNAAARHKLYRDQGEEIDPDSGYPHEYHELWNHMAAMELKLRGK